MRFLFVKTRFITFFIFVLFLSGELFLRLFKGEEMVLHRYPSIYTVDSAMGFKGLPYGHGYLRRPSIDKKIDLNKFGFYGPDFRPEHPDSIFRIIIYGTSSAEGIWSDTTETFPRVLEELFRKSNYRVEVINCAVGGVWRGLQTLSVINSTAYRFHANLVLLERRIPFWSANYTRDRVSGHLVTFAGETGIELAHSRRIAEKRIAIMKENKLATDVYDMCYLSRFLTRAFNGSEPGTILNCWNEYSLDYPTCWQYLMVRKDSIHATVRTLNDLAGDLKNAGCGLVLFKYENPPKPKGEKEYPDLAVDELFLGIDMDAPKNHLKLDGHPNARGKQLIAEKLFIALTPTYIPLKFKSP